MTTGLDELIPRDRRATTKTIVAGRIANTPSSSDDDLFVTVGSFDGHRQQWGPCPWVPASTLPTRGEPCVVLLDERGAPTVLTFAADVAFLAGGGAPAAGDGIEGSIYLDLATLAFWGPKTAGAWPAEPFGRLLPMEPTYAELAGT